MAPWRPPPSFPCKSSFYSIKGVQPREVVHIGRKAKPIHLHLLEGNTNRLTKDEIEQRLKAENSYKQKDKVKPPTWLDSVRRKNLDGLPVNY